MVGRVEDQVRPFPRSWETSSAAISGRRAGRRHVLVARRRGSWRISAVAQGHTRNEYDQRRKKGAKEQRTRREGSTEKKYSTRARISPAALTAPGRRAVSWQRGAYRSEEGRSPSRTCGKCRQTRRERHPHSQFRVMDVRDQDSEPPATRPTSGRASSQRLAQSDRPPVRFPGEKKPLHERECTGRCSRRSHLSKSAMGAGTATPKPAWKRSTSSRRRESGGESECRPPTPPARDLLFSRSQYAAASGRPVTRAKSAVRPSGSALQEWGSGIRCDRARTRQANLLTDLSERDVRSRDPFMGTLAGAVRRRGRRTVLPLGS